MREITLSMESVVLIVTLLALAVAAVMIEAHHRCERHERARILGELRRHGRR